MHHQVRALPPRWQGPLRALHRVPRVNPAAREAQRALTTGAAATARIAVLPARAAYPSAPAVDPAARAADPAARREGLGAQAADPGNPRLEALASNRAPPGADPVVRPEVAARRAARWPAPGRRVGEAETAANGAGRACSANRDHDSAPGHIQCHQSLAPENSDRYRNRNRSPEHTGRRRAQGRTRFSTGAPRVTPRRSTNRALRSASARWSMLGCAVTSTTTSAASTAGSRLTLSRPSAGTAGT